MKWQVATAAALAPAGADIAYRLRISYRKA
jgi:hypothetical protein